MAKKPNISAGISLDGEKEFKKALSEINAGLKVNYSQMALVAAQYDSAGNSQDALTAKTEALRLAIHSQTDKVNTLKAALANAVEKHGEGSKAAMQYQTSLNSAEAELVKMNGTMGDYQQALLKSNTGVVSLADVTKGLAGVMGIDVPPAAQAVVNKLDGVSASGAAAVGIIAGVITGLAKLSINAAHTADDILTLSSTTGLSTDALQEFNYASDFLDVSTETMTGSLTKMTRTMDAARKGTKDAADAYKTLHIKVKDGHGALRDANTVFYEAIDALGKVKNETERDALAMTIFGKSAKELNPLIEAGSNRLRELGVEAHNMGYVMDSETLGSFGKLQDCMDKMTRQSDALKNSLAIALLPMLTALFGAISAIPVPVLQTIVVLTTAIASILLIVKSIKEMTSTASAIKGFFSGFDVATLKTTGIVLGVVAALVALGVIIAVIVGKQGELNAAMNGIGNMTSNITGAANQTVNPKYAYAAGTDNHPGGYALVGENGPEVAWLPRGTKVWPSGQTPGGYVDQRQYNFQVSGLDEFIAIRNHLESEQMQMRQGRV